MATVEVHIPTVLPQGLNEHSVALLLESAGLSSPFSNRYQVDGDTLRLYFDGELTEEEILQDLPLILGGAEGPESEEDEDVGYAFGSLSNLEPEQGTSVRENPDGDSGAWSTPTFSTLLPQPVFSSLGIGACLYLGTDVPPVAVVLDLDQPVDLGEGGDVAFEYWDGVSWKETPTMALTEEGTSLTENHFGSVGRVFVRFDYRVLATESQATELDNLTRHWIRFRVASELTSAPQVKEAYSLTKGGLHSMDGGSVQLFGSAERSHKLLWARKLEDDLWRISPSNQGIFASRNIVLTPVDNGFKNGAVDGNGAEIELPEGLDTSRNLTFCIKWFPLNDKAGDVEFIFDYIVKKDGELVDGESDSRRIRKIVQAPEVERQVMCTMIDFSIPEGAPGDSLYIGYRRDASTANGNDTFDGNVGIIGTTVTGFNWR